MKLELNATERGLIRVALRHKEEACLIEAEHTYDKEREKKWREMAAEYAALAKKIQGE